MTIAVVPRDTRSQIRSCLETLVANTPAPYRLVVVDACYPKRTRRWLDNFASKHDATLLRGDCILTQNEARNAALDTVETEHVVFLDDSCFVKPGWLQPLLECADRTGAAIVGPLYGFRTGRFQPETVHVFDSPAHLVTHDGRRQLVDETPHIGKPLDVAAAEFTCRPGETAEFHCMLVRTELFDQLGPFDERLLTSREHLDFCMLAREAGHTVWLEPASVVVFELLIPLGRGDRGVYIFRWSREMNRRTLASFAEKWGLDWDLAVEQMTDFVDQNRRIAYIASPKLVNFALQKLSSRALEALDRIATHVVVARHTRLRAASRGVRVAHASSWLEPAVSVDP